MSNAGTVTETTKEELTPAQLKLLEWQGSGFDLRTSIVDPMSGKLIRHQPYRRVVNGAECFYIRDGKRYSESGHWLDAPGVKANR